MNHTEDSSVGVTWWDPVVRVLSMTLAVLAGLGIAYGLVDAARSGQPDWPFLLRISAVEVLAIMFLAPWRGWRFWMLLLFGAILAFGGVYMARSL
jgi:hypothetical protein